MSSSSEQTTIQSGEESPVYQAYKESAAYKAYKAHKESPIHQEYLQSRVILAESEIARLAESEKKYGPCFTTDLGRAILKAFPDTKGH